MPDPPMMPSTACVMTIPQPRRGTSRVAGHARPHLLLGEIQQPGEYHEKDHHLQADALARDQVRLGRPLQECGAALGIVRPIRRRALRRVPLSLRGDWPPPPRRAREHFLPPAPPPP